MRPSEVLLLLALVSGPFVGPAHAQALSCTAPANIPAPAQPAQGGQSSIHVRHTGYLLALSWSPEFCRARPDQARHRLQCSGQMGRFGFILHGLWPDAPGRSDPRWCRPVRVPDAATIRANLCITPSADLLAHEWAKHGSCAFADARSYYRAGSGLFSALRFPDMNGLSRRKRLNAGDLRRAFRAANPTLQVESIGVVANRRQWLQEVRLCLGRDYRPRACSAEDKGVLDHVPVKIWRGA